LSIKPVFAEAIFQRRKLFEFRRSIFRQPVQTVVVYVTRPVAQVVGEFDVASIVHGRVEQLWTNFNTVAGIDRDEFFNYFKGRKCGYAIGIGRVELYKTPIVLDRIGVAPPQSFIYLAEHKRMHKPHPDGDA
jgi:predicted transcriptional regulator